MHTNHHTVDSHEQELLRLSNADELVEVVEDFQNHVLLRQPDAALRIAMGAVVDHAVHVQVQVVDDRHDRAATRLVDERIPLAQPSVELGDTCGPEVEVAAREHEL